MRRIADNAYDSYISHTVYSLNSAIKLTKHTNLAGDPVNSVKIIHGRSTRCDPAKWTIKTEYPYFVIGIELSQARAKIHLNKYLGEDLSLLVTPGESDYSE